MPTYDYKCNKCGKTFEVFQKITDKPIKTCIYCKGKVKRLIGPGLGIIFRGSGFYETDYKRKKHPKPAEGKNQCDSCSDSSCNLKKDKQ